MKISFKNTSLIQLIDREVVVYWSLFLGGLLWTVHLGLSSPGVALHDELGHYLVSRNAWQYPQLMLDLWGRTMNTLLYMLPARWGFMATRAYSVIILAAGTVILTSAVAQKVGVKNLFLIPLFLWFQPWFNNLSYTILPQVPFSFILILGIYLWISGRNKAAGVTFGLLPLVRHEGIILLALWGMYQLYRNNWSTVVLMSLPIILYNITFYVAMKQLAFQIYLSPIPTQAYGHGGWWHFFPRVVLKVGLPVLILSLFAIQNIRLLGEKGIFFWLYVAYFLTHVIIYRFGLFASAGYSLFLLPLAPAFAIAAALGFGYLQQYARFNKPFTLLRNGKYHRLILVFIVILVLLNGLASRPRKIDNRTKLIRETVDWLQTRDLQTNKIVSTHVWFYYLLDLPWKPEERWDFPHNLDKSDSATILIWDGKYSERYGIPLQTLSSNASEWNQLKEFGDGFIIIFQKK